MRTVEIKTTDGKISVPAADEMKGVEHFAVTMRVFGAFDVTHIPSGYRMVYGFESCVAATIAMVQLQIAMNELEIDCSVGYDELRGSMFIVDRATDVMGMTIREWASMHAFREKMSILTPEGAQQWAELNELMSQLEVLE